MGTSKIYFGHMVTPLRAEFLARMLEVPLCRSCGRERAECEAEPCCRTCGKVECECADKKAPHSKLHAVHVFEKTMYTVFVEAIDADQVERVMDWMNGNHWEPVRAAAGEWDVRRSWNIEIVENPVLIKQISEDEIIDAGDWETSE